jgi:glycosyltransferase involved in cell wall biosynthesis
MVSFRGRISQGLRRRGIEVCLDLDETPYDAVLVIGGTRQLGKLWRVKRRGIPIVQRLNGMNWVHRRLATGMRHYLRAEYGNWLLAFIRRRLASGIVYQSNFARHWWRRVYGSTNTVDCVVYNAVDLEAFSPRGSNQRPIDRYRLLLVEGSLMGGYESGLATAVDLVQHLRNQHSETLEKPVELMVVGEVSQELKQAWDERMDFPILWRGVVPGGEIPHIDRSAHLLFSADVNAACPNAAIEAMACGLPVIGFDTGALPELVQAGAGRVVPYGGDPWQLEPPDSAGLAAAASQVLTDQQRFRAAARLRAEVAFGLDAMVDGYLAALTREY